MSSASTPLSKSLSITQVLICGAAIVTLSMGIRHGFGLWLGGVLYDRTGSYDIVWTIAIALGVFAALVNLPVKETAIVRPPRGHHGAANAA